jgi:hypothetical protein
MKSEKSALSEFSNTLEGFIKLKQNSIFELGVNFNTLKYPANEALCLKGLIMFFDCNHKMLEKTIIRGSNVSKELLNNYSFFILLIDFSI